MYHVLRSSSFALIKLVVTFTFVIFHVVYTAPQKQFTNLINYFQVIRLMGNKSVT